MAVANLACTFVLVGKVLLVVDTDLRRLRQHCLFGPGNGVGVSKHDRG